MAGGQAQLGAAGPARDPLGPIEVSPDPRRARARRSWVHARLPGWLQRRYEAAVVPADVPQGYAGLHLTDLWKRVATTDVGAARALLAEAEAIHGETNDRIDSAERRATTLQGTVAIAASAAIAGGGLILDKVSGSAGWRVTFAAVLAGVVLTLLACAVRAASVTGRIFQFEDGGIERAAARAHLPEALALSYRAAELLRAADVADMIASVKVGLLRSAAYWFRWALKLIAALGVLVCIYIALGPPANAAQPAPAPAAGPARHAGQGDAFERWTTFPGPGRLLKP